MCKVIKLIKASLFILLHFISTLSCLGQTAKPSPCPSPLRNTYEGLTKAESWYHNFKCWEYELDLQDFDNCQALCDNILYYAAYSHLSYQFREHQICDHLTIYLSFGLHHFLKAKQTKMGRQCIDSLEQKVWPIFLPLAKDVHSLEAIQRMDSLIMPKVGLVLQREALEQVYQYIDAQNQQKD